MESRETRSSHRVDWWIYLVGILSLAGALILGRAASQGNLVGVDVAVSNTVHGWTMPWLTWVFLVITYSASAAATVVFVVIAGALIWRLADSVGEAVTLTLSVALSAGFVALLKVLFQRSRPDLFGPLTGATGFSFPSGHTLNAAVLYGLLGILVTRGRSRQTRLAVAALVMLWILLVGLSRIYLGVHYFSDVLASLLIGISWLLGTWLFLRWLSRRQDPAT